jgi:hypothetical protein
MAKPKIDPLDFSSYRPDWAGGEDSTSGGMLDLYRSLAEGFPGAKITSLLRTPEHNKEVGGVGNSQHVAGTAGDFVLPKDERGSFIARAREMGLEAINEGDHIHLELPPGADGSAVAKSKPTVKDPLDFTSYEPDWAAGERGSGSTTEYRAPEEEETKADFSGVKDGTDEANKGFFEKRNDVLAQNIDELKTFGKGVLGSLESKASGAAALAADYGDVIYPLASKESQQGALDINKSLNAKSAENMAAYQAGAEDMKKRYPAWMVDSVGDITQNPESAASIVGGPAAVVPGASVFLQEYGQSRAAGLTPKESAANAAIQGGTEMAIESIPSGKILSRLPVVGPVIKKFERGVAQSLESRFGQALNTAVRATTTAAGEGLEEGVTGIIQDAERRAQASKELLIGSDAAKAYAQTQVIEDGHYWENIVRQARAGALMGGSIGGLQGTVQGAQQGQQMRQERQTGLENAINTNLGNELLARKGETDRADTTLNQDIGFELQRKQADEAKQQAFEQAEKAAEEQRGLEEEAGFQTLERGSVSPSSRVEKYAGVVERVPVEPAREVTAEDVAGQRVAAERAEAERVARVAEGKAIEKQRKTAAKKTAKVVATPETEAVPTASSIEKVKPLPPIVDPRGKKPAPANVIPPATKPIQSQTESELDDLVKNMGLSLGMADSAADLKAAGAKRNAAPAEEAATEEPADIDVAGTLADFQPKAKALVKALAGRTKQDSRDLQTVIHQGKLVVAPNAKSIGREGEGRQAEYDMGTGKMYLYTDHINPNDSISNIAAALHEANHSLLTPEQIEASAGKLRVAARNGNTHAKEALRLAQADTDARSGDSQFENEELLAYFASNLKLAEGKSLGTVGAVVRDLTSAARGAIRKHVNADLDINIGEIGTALSGALGDVAKTDIKGRNASGSLAMVYNKNSAGYDEAATNGWVYDSKDGEKKYVLSDKDATLKDGARVRLRDTNTTPKLSDVLDHPVLYKEHPKAKNIPVYVVDEIPGTPGGFALYDSEDQSIWVTKAAVNATTGTSTKLKEAMMHEIQHYVQDEGGYLQNEAYSDTPEIAAVKDTFAKQNAAQKTAARTMLDEVPNAVRDSLDRIGKNEMADIMFDRESTDVVKASQLSDLLSEQEVELSGPAATALQKYRDARAARNGSITAYNDALTTAHDNYLANVTEREAFRTQADTELGEEGVRARGNPEPQMADQSTASNPRTAGRVDVPETSYAERYREAAGVKSLGMAVQSPERKAARRSTAVVDFLTPQRFENAGQSGRVIVTNLFQNGKGLGKGILEAFEFAKSSPAAEEAKANASLGKYDKALHTQGAQQGITPEALNNKIMEELDAIDQTSNSYDTNIAAYKAVTSKYGEAGRHLLDLRNQTDALTLEMLKQRASANVKPSAAEAKTLATLAANMGRYSHRLYAAHQGKAGKKYAYAVLDAYTKGKKGKTLTQHQQDTYEMVRRAVKVLVDDNLMIPDDAGLSELSADAVSRLYRTWGSNPNGGVTSDEMRDELASIREDINGDTTRLQTTAEEIVKQLLDIAKKGVNQPIASYYRGGKQDRGILQERSKIPAELRAVMGEITDPGTRLLASVAKQAEFVARTKFLLEVKNKAADIDLQPPSATGLPIVKDNHMTRLDGEGYGPLNGWYASPNLQSMLSDVREVLATFEQVTAEAGSNPGKLTNATLTKALDIWMGVAGKSKQLQIIGNLFLQPLNFLGSFGALAVNGNIRPDTYGKGFLDAVALVRYARNPSLGLGRADAAVRYGVTDSATVGELKGLPYEKIQTFAKLMSGKKPSTIFRALKSANMTLTEGYAMMDVWAKIANFHNEVEQLKSYYKKNNESRTEEEINREAADIVNRTNVTYKRAVPIIKAFERGGITNFGTYFYETFRSQLGNAYQGLKEITVDVAKAKTPAAKAEKLARGTKRLAGQAAFWGFATEITSVLNAMMFGDDDDDWDKRALLPEYMQNQDMYTVGLDANGKPIMFAVSRVDPFGPVTDIMRQAALGGMDFEKGLKQLTDLYVTPRIVPQIVKLVGTIAGDDRPTKTPLIQELTPEGFETALKVTKAGGMRDQTTRAWVNAAEGSFLPGTLNAYREKNPIIAQPAIPENATEGEKIAANVTAQVFSAARYFGATFVKANPDTAVYFANKNLEDVIKSGRKDMSDLFSDRPNVTDKEIQDLVQEVQTAERKRWNELARVYRGMKATGMEDKDINAALKDSQISGPLKSSLVNQKFESSAVSKQSFDSLMKKQLSGKNEAEKKEITQKWKEAWTRLEKAQEGIE